MACMEGCLPGGTRPNTPHHHTWVYGCRRLFRCGCAGAVRREGYGRSAWAVVLGHGRGAPLKTAVACSSSSQHWSQGDETSGMGMLANGKSSIHGITVSVRRASIGVSAGKNKKLLVIFPLRLASCVLRTLPLTSDEHALRGTLYVIREAP